MSAMRAQYPGGFWIGYNWAIDRPSTAKLVELAGYAHAEGYERVNLLLGSTGGLLADAHYAVECLSALPVEYVTWNVSAVQSAANLLFALGVERYAVPGSTFFFHQTGFEGVAGQHLSEADFRDKLRQIEIGDERSARFVAGRTPVLYETLTGWAKAGTTLAADEAVKAGLAHDVRRPSIPKDAWFRQSPAA